MIKYNIKNIFIIGVGRSGTSLLQSIIDSHSQCVFLPETRFLRKYLFPVRVKRKIENENVNYFKQLLYSDLGFKRLELNLDKLFSSTSDRVNVLEFYNLVIKKYVDGKDELIIGDKDPRNIENIDKLNKYFPHSKILHIIRDPRDVVLSRTKANWSKGRPWWLHTFIYSYQFNIARAKVKPIDPISYYELKYENLIQNAEYEVTKICEYLGLEYESDMLKFQASSKRLVASSEMQWKKETLGELKKDNLNKWEKSLTNFQIAFIERNCSEIHYKYHYRVSNAINKLTLIQRLSLSVFSNFKYILYPIYKIKVKYYAG